MHAVSPNFDINTTGSGATATYTLTGKANGTTSDCTGING
jgi:hypothetical protein